MIELLNELFKNEVLSDDTKTLLEKAFQTKLNEAVEAVKAETAIQVRTELTEQFITEKNALVEALEDRITDYMAEEFNELKADIDRFRDLEAEYAQRIIEAKAEMSNELKSDLKELVNHIDTFLDMQIANEMKEFRNDMKLVKANDFGRRIFEAYAAEFEGSYADTDKSAKTLRRTSKKLNEANDELAKTQRKLAKLERKVKMNEVLAPLADRPREVMEAILQSVPTAELGTAYKHYIGRVLKETTTTTTKTKTVVTESKTATAKPAFTLVENKDFVKKTGDKVETQTVVTEGVAPEVKNMLEEMKKLGGVTLA